LATGYFEVFVGFPQIQQRK